MTQLSRFWNGVVVGDAVEAPYDADDEFAKVLQSLVNADADPNGGRVCRGVLNGLACSGAASPVSVATGRAIVDGSWYENTAIVAVNLTLEYGYIVLRKTTISQQVRLDVVESAVGLPALTQVRGTTWEYPLYSFHMVGGVVTLTDVRTFTALTALSHGVFIELLADTTLAAPAASLALSEAAGNPWSNFSALKLVISGRSDQGGAGAGFDTVLLRFNGDATNVYSFINIDANMNALLAESDTVATAQATIGAIPTSIVGHDAAAQGIIECLIPHINSLLFYKMWKSEFICIYDPTDNTYAYNASGVTGGVWYNAAIAAITSLTLFLGSGNNFATGTRFTLYGYPKNAL